MEFLGISLFNLFICFFIYSTIKNKYESKADSYLDEISRLKTENKRLEMKYKILVEKIVQRAKGGHDETKTIN